MIETTGKSNHESVEKKTTKHNTETDVWDASKLNAYRNLKGSAMSVHGVADAVVSLSEYFKDALNMDDAIDTENLDPLLGNLFQLSVLNEALRKMTIAKVLKLRVMENTIDRLFPAQVVISRNTSIDALRQYIEKVKNEGLQDEDRQAKATSVARREDRRAASARRHEEIISRRKPAGGKSSVESG